MKKLITAAILILLVYSCKKDAGKDPGTNIYLHSVLSHLRDSLSEADLSRLDTTKAILSDPGKAQYYTLRIPFVGKSIAEDFMLLRTDATGSILRGQIVHLESENASESSFSGKIKLNSLSGRVLLQSTISNGYIDALHNTSSKGNQIKEIDSKTVTVLPAPDADWLPEVVVVGYGSASPPTNYIALDGLLGVSSSGILAGGGGGSSSSGAPSGGGGGGSNSNGDAANNNTPPPVYSPVDPSPDLVKFSHGAGLGVTPSLELEQDYVNSIPIIDIRKFFNCFDKIPDAGASYSVQLCVDVPINGNPAASSNVLSASAGHSFLIVTKTGNGVSITQSFGYYPASKPSVWNPFNALTSAIKNNGGQEINGSLTISISNDQFKNLKTQAITLSTHPYVLDSFNCTDYALGVFNSVRASPITLDPYIIRQPGIIISGAPASTGFTVAIANSPQQLFERFSQMKATSSPEASNIQLDLSHNLSAPDSHGECN